MFSLLGKYSYVMRCAIWYHLNNLKNENNTHWGVLLLVKLQVSSCNFTKSNFLLWVFFSVFKLCKCTICTKSRNASHIESCAEMIKTRNYINSLVIAEQNVRIFHYMHLMKHQSSLFFEEKLPALLSSFCYLFHT